MDSPVNEIKQRLSIVEVIKDYLPHLKPSGTNWKGLCPFHTEKTPSFMVSEDKGIWHCFGCNEGGDMFTFVMKINGVEFGDALRLLADKAGVELRRTDPGLLTLRNKLLDMHVIAEDVFTNELQSEKGKEANAYLKSRGISEHEIRELGLGFSPDSWDALHSLYKREGFTPREILASGLVVKNEKGRVYDRFRNRLMFPLRNLQGQVIGFAGRTLSREDAKYINSPQTMLYNKSEFLYGLDRAKTAIRENDAVIIVEGYFDWLSVYRTGMRNVVAVSGTALTRDHLSVLKRYTGNMVLALDADSAGEEATKKGVLLALQNGCTVYVIPYGPHGYKDPDELIEKDPSLWARLYKERVLALDYLLTTLFGGITPGDIIQKKKAMKAYLPFLKAAHDIEQEHFITKLSTVSGISTSLILEEMRNLKDERGETVPAEAAASYEPSIGWRWIGLLVSHPSVLATLSDTVSDEHIKDSDVQEVFRALKQFIAGHAKGFSIVDFNKTHPYANLLNIWLLKIEELYRSFTPEEIIKEARLLTARLKEEFFRDALARVTQEIVAAEQEQNEEKIAKLLERHTTITSELADLLK